jgi:hypothetical protein
VNSESEPVLLAWLRADHEPGRGWDPEPPRTELGCDPKLVARLAEITRPLGATRRVFVGGCPVVHHPGGRPIAAAAGATWFAARSGLPAGALRPVAGADVVIGAGWVELDPWVADAAFARAIDLLRAHVSRAYEVAEARA